MVATTATPLAATIGYRLMKLGELATERAVAVLAPAGLRPRQFNVLATLSRDATLSQRQLSAVLGIDPNVMVTVIDDLEELGFARRERSTVDRRRHVVVVTPQGRRALATATRLSSEAEQEFLAALSPEDRRTLHRVAGTLLGLDEAEGQRAG